MQTADMKHTELNRKGEETNRSTIGLPNTQVTYISQITLRKRMLATKGG
jgi:hypothetical protein